MGGGVVLVCSAVHRIALHRHGINCSGLGSLRRALLGGINGRPVRYVRERAHFAMPAAIKYKPSGVRSPFVHAPDQGGRADVPMIMQ
jgi:hypothetical protein